MAPGPAGNYTWRCYRLQVEHCLFKSAHNSAPACTRCMRVSTVKIHSWPTTGSGVVALLPVEVALGASKTRSRVDDVKGRNGVECERMPPAEGAFVLRRRPLTALLLHSTWVITTRGMITEILLPPGRISSGAFLPMPFYTWFYVDAAEVKALTEIWRVCWGAISGNMPSA